MCQYRRSVRCAHHYWSLLKVMNVLADVQQSTSRSCEVIAWWMWYGRYYGCKYIWTACSVFELVCVFSGRADSWMFARLLCQRTSYYSGESRIIINQQAVEMTWAFLAGVMFHAGGKNSRGASEPVIISITSDNRSLGTIQTCFTIFHMILLLVMRVLHLDQVWEPF